MSSLLLPVDPSQPRSRLTVMENIDDKLILNVWGACIMRPTLSTVQTFPGTCLYKLNKLSTPDTPSTQCPYVQRLFFDQNPELFGYVLGYYYTWQLHCPANIC